MRGLLRTATQPLDIKAPSEHAPNKHTITQKAKNTTFAFFFMKPDSKSGCFHKPINNSVWRFIANVDSTLTVVPWITERKGVVGKKKKSRKDEVS